MQVSILGPGAVGTLIGALLSLKGHQVNLRGRRAPVRAGTGVRVVLPGGWHRADGVIHEGPEAEAGPADAVLVTLGRHHLHAVRRPDFVRYTGANDAPVGLFNCDPTEAERLAIPPERVRLCLSLMTAVKLQDGDVELATEKPVIVYEEDPVLDRLFRDLAPFGFQSLSVTDARPALNSLMVIQLLYLPVAMCNTTIDVFLSFPEGRELAAGLLGEGCAAMEKAGMPMAPLPVMDPRELAARLERKPGSLDRDTGQPDRGYNTILQAYLRSRPTEAAQLNRRMVEIASGAGLHLTWNWRMLQKVSRVSGLGFYRTPSDLLRSLV